MRVFRFACWLSMALVVRGWAQQPQSGLADVSLEELGQIQVFSASEHSQDVREAPSSVTVITAEEIRRHGFRTLSDVLRSVREFYVSYDRDYGFVGFRGFGRPGDYNSRMLLLVNGHRTNDNIYDQAMLGTEFLVDLDLIQRIEVIRGPGSSLYGSNAFFAVINVITRSASELPGWQLAFEPSSFGTYKARTSYGGKALGTDVVISVTASNSAGQSLYFPEFDSAETNNGIARQLDFDRFLDVFFLVRHGPLTVQVGGNWRTKGIPTAPWGTLFNDPLTFNRDQHQLADLAYKPRFGAWDASARVYYDRYGYDAKWPYIEGQINVDWARGQMWGTEIQFSRDALKRHHFTFGTEIRDNFQQDQSNFDIQPVSQIYVDSHEKSWLWAMYGQDEVALTKALRLNAGLRFDSYNIIDNRFNPRLGLIFRPVETTTFKFLYGSAFRAPNVFERYYGSDSSVNLSGYRLNPHLESEKINNFEGVWEQDLGKHVRWSTNVFRNNARDLISAASDPENGMLMYVNADRSRSVGIGAELGGQTSNGISGSAAYSFNETVDPKSALVPPNSPRQLGKAHMTVPLIRSSLFGGLALQYEGSRKSLTGALVPSFVVANATISGCALGNRLEISGSVYNLANQGFFDVAPPEDIQDVLRQDGRAFQVKLIWHISGDR